MKTTALIMGGALAVTLLAVNCPASVRDAVSARTQIPDHVYEEAERQLDVFVSWARNEANVPQMDPRDLPAS